MTLPSLIGPLAALLLAPLLPGIVQRTKAFCAGRTGPPLLQPYRDLGKLWSKGAVYSSTTTWVFRAAPVVGLAAALVGLAVLPLGVLPPPLAFPGDFLLLVYLLGTARLLTVLGALDTGSSFEGMGASREVCFAALAEPALLLALAAVARSAGTLSLSGMIPPPAGALRGPTLALVAAALVIIALTENCRIPVDDPSTHLELTMIHEVMVLDHGGPDLALIHYAAALKLWIFGAILAGLLLPLRDANPWVASAAFVAGLSILAVLLGLIESTMARLRLFRVPQFLAAATAFSVLALILVLR
jgi:formate hydrogenlyase subunit 4